jgi:hypothetical protein
MSLKSRVFHFINSHGLNDISPVQWREFQKSAKGLRIKYNNDRTIELNFEGRGPWFKSHEFYNEFRETYEKKLAESIQFFLAEDPSYLKDYLDTNIFDRRKMFNAFTYVNKDDYDFENEELASKVEKNIDKHVRGCLSMAFYDNPFSFLD